MGMLSEYSWVEWSLLLILPVMGFVLGWLVRWLLVRRRTIRFQDRLKAKQVGLMPELEPVDSSGLGELTDTAETLNWFLSQLDDVRHAYQQLLDAVPGAIFAKDSDGRYLLCNESFARFITRNEGGPELLCGHTDFDYLNKEQAQFHRNEDLNVMELGQRIQEDITAPDEDGLERVWDQTKAPIFDREGAIIGIAGISRDITRRFHEYESLLEALKRFRLLFDSVEMIAVQGYDEQRNITYWNRSSSEFYGFTEAEAMGRPIDDLIIPASKRAEFVASHERWLGRGEPIEAAEASAISKFGEFIPVFSHYVSVFAPGGSREFYRVDIDLRVLKEQEAELSHLNQQLAGMNRQLEEQVDARTRELLESNNQLRKEISIRHATTDQLGRSEEKYRKTMELASDAVFLVIPENGRILEANMSACRLIDRKLSDIQGLELDVLLFEEDGDLFRKALQDCFDGNQESVQGDFTVVDKGGRRVPVSVSSSRLSLKEDDFFMFVLRDITERKHVEDENLMALENLRELNEMKARFIALVTHEVRTPLTAIASSSELLSSSFEKLSVDRRQRHLHNILESVARIRELTDGVTFISRVQQGRQQCELSPFDLGLFVRSVVDFLEADARYSRIQIDVDKALAEPVMLDKHLMKLILQNLLQNALKYSGKESPVRLGLHRSGNWLELSVEDEGIGIPIGEQKHLFDSFFRASNARDIPGTGLGLYITRNAVEAHEGKISWETQEERGTVFRVSLPLKFAHENDIGNRG